MNSDFVIETCGSIWTFCPMTDTAKNFVGTDLNVESWQWLGTKFGVDARIAANLVTALEDEGFVLEIR